MFKFSGKRPSNLGVKDGRLARTVNKPNNVSSQADAGDRAHYVAPLPLSGTPTAAMAKLKTLVESMPRTSVVASRADYLYVEFSTPLMGYTDDVEFYCDGQAIQVRSASRLGYSDMGVNRKRVETIRAALAG
jgi:uncharacterized protein (DUF1499 family)